MKHLSLITLFGLLCFSSFANSNIFFLKPEVSHTPTQDVLTSTLESLKERGDELGEGQEQILGLVRFLEKIRTNFIEQSERTKPLQNKVFSTTVSSRQIQDLKTFGGISAGSQAKDIFKAPDKQDFDELECSDKEQPQLKTFTVTLAKLQDTKIKLSKNKVKYSLGRRKTFEATVPIDNFLGEEPEQGSQVTDESLAQAEKSCWEALDDEVLNWFKGLANSFLVSSDYTSDWKVVRKNCRKTFYHVVGTYEKTSSLTAGHIPQL